MGSLPGCPEPQHWLHPLPFSQRKCWLLLGTSPCSSCTEFFCYQTSWKPGDLQPCYHSNHSITRYVDDSAAKIMFYSRAQAKKKNNQNPLEQHKCSLFSFSTDNWNLLLATGDNPAELRCVYMVWDPLSRSSVTKPLLFPSQLSLTLSVCRFSPFFLAFLCAFTWLRTVFHPSAPGSWSIASSSPWLACFCAPKAQFAHMAFPRRIQG